MKNNLRSNIWSVIAQENHGPLSILGHTLTAQQSFYSIHSPFLFLFLQEQLLNWGFKEFTLLKPKCPELWANVRVSHIYPHRIKNVQL